MSEPHKPSDEILEQAADWLMAMDSCDWNPELEKALHQWRSQGPEHEKVWQLASRLKSMLGAVPPELGASALGRERLDRRTVLKSLAALAVVPATGWLGYSRLPSRLWHADIRTTKGEQRTVSLPDGGELVLNTDTAVDICYSENARIVKLHCGEIQVTTVSDQSMPQLPLLVETKQGRIRALGTQFIVRAGAPGYYEEKSHTIVTVIRHAVAVRPTNALQETIVNADLQVEFSDHRVQPPKPAPDHAHAWLRGQVIADNQRLGAFLTEVSRYRPGVIRVDRAVKDLRISGVFQLKNTDQVLEILANTLPIRISRVTDYWVTVAPV